MKIYHEISTHGKDSITCRTKLTNSYSHWFHWHEKYEICQLLNQPCSFLIDGTRIDAAPGDIVTFKERSIHCFFIAHENTHIRILQLPTKILLNAGIPVKTLKPHITRKELEDISGLYRTTNTLFELLEQECNNQHPETPFLHSLTASLYFLFMQHFSENSSIHNATKEQNEFYKIVEYVNEHFMEDINISTLSEKMFLSRGKLSSIFTKYSGTSLNEYINSLRIKNVNDLMRQGHSITQAALESGFQSIRTFNNVYKKITGTTPSDYAGKK